MFSLMRGCAYMCPLMRGCAYAQVLEQLASQATPVLTPQQTPQRVSHSCKVSLSSKEVQVTIHFKTLAEGGVLRVLLSEPTVILAGASSLTLSDFFLDAPGPQASPAAPSIPTAPVPAVVCPDDAVDHQITGIEGEILLLHTRAEELRCSKRQLWSEQFMLI
eukprot:5761915-Amphidinium_carterae.1